jgi:hypothetical protein
MSHFISVLVVEFIGKSAAGNETKFGAYFIATMMESEYQT